MFNPVKFVLSRLLNPLCGMSAVLQFRKMENVVTKWVTSLFASKYYQCAPAEQNKKCYLYLTALAIMLYAHYVKKLNSLFSSYLVTNVCFYARRCDHGAQDYEWGSSGVDILTLSGFDLKKLYLITKLVWYMAYKQGSQQHKIAYGTTGQKNRPWSGTVNKTQANVSRTLG